MTKKTFVLTIIYFFVAYGFCFSQDQAKPVLTFTYDHFERFMPIPLNGADLTAQFQALNVSWESVRLLNSNEPLRSASALAAGSIVDFGATNGSLHQMTITGTAPSSFKVQIRAWSERYFAVPYSAKMISENVLRAAGVDGIIGCYRLYSDGNVKQLAPDEPWQVGYMITVTMDRDTTLDLVALSFTQGEQVQAPEVRKDIVRGGSPDDGTKVVVLYDSTYQTKLYKCWASGKSGAWDGVTDAFSGADNVKNAGVVRRGKTMYVKDEAGMTASTPVTIYAPSDPGVARQAVSWTVSWDSAKSAAAIAIPADAAVGDYQVQVGSTAGNYCTVYVIFDPSWATSKMTADQYKSWAYNDLDWSTVADKKNYLNYVFEGGIGTYVWGYRGASSAEAGADGGVFGQRMVEMACTVQGSGTKLDSVAAIHVYQVMGQRLTWTSGGGYGGYVNGKYNTFDMTLSGTIINNSGSTLTKDELNVIAAEKAALGLGFTDRLASNYVFAYGQCMNFGTNTAALMRSIGIPSYCQYTDNGAGWPGSFHAWCDAAIQDSTYRPHDTAWWKGTWWKYDSCTSYTSSSYSHIEGQIAPIVIDGFGDYMLNEYSRCQGIGYNGQFETNSKQCTSKNGTHTGVQIRPGTSADAEDTDLLVEYGNTSQAWNLTNMFVPYNGPATPASDSDVKDSDHGYALNSTQKGSSGGSGYVSNSTGEDDLPQLLDGVEQKSIVAGMGFNLYRIVVNGRASIPINLISGADKVEFVARKDAVPYSTSGRWSLTYDFISSNGSMTADTSGVTYLYVLVQLKTHTGTSQQAAFYSILQGETVSGPTANFSYSVASGSRLVTFTDQSTCNGCTIAGYAWTFGDSTSSSLQNPTHTYASDGTYTVNLVVTSNQSPAKTASTSKTLTINANAPKIIGYTDIFASTSTNGNLTAQPVTMPENGTIQSITMYHGAGSGNLIFAVYDGASSPGNRLAVTNETALSTSTGWQTVNLATPVTVAAGTQLWLAWVYQSNPGIVYQSGDPGRARSSLTWPSMPNPFGTATQSSSIYSIYATYTTTPPPAGKEQFVGSFTGSGIWLCNPNDSTWAQLNSLDAGQLAVGDVDKSGKEDILGIYNVGFWIRLDNGTWQKVEGVPNPSNFCTGDLNYDGYDDIVGTWSGIGVWVRYSGSNTWAQIHTRDARMLFCGDFDNDGKNDFGGAWDPEGIFVKYSSTGGWAKVLDQTNLLDIKAADLNNDGRSDILSNWTFGLFGFDFGTSSWTKIFDAAEGKIAAGDLDGDKSDDAIATWSGVGGIWAKQSSAGWYRIHANKPACFIAGKLY